MERPAAILEHPKAKRDALGQFLTPTPVADLLASFFDGHWQEVELLDAGAGAGALTAAFVRRLCRTRRKPTRIAVTAYELDSDLLRPLRATLRECEGTCEHAGISFDATVVNEDFIASAVPQIRGDLFGSRPPRFNAAIVNPPYRKIRSDSVERTLLRSAGIETGNLYAGFVALIIKLLADGGEFVAITPRSFCNGPYFKPFRVDFLKTMSLRRMHVFESRSAAFSKDDVLQENVIMHAVKGGPKPERVIVSCSSGKPESAISEREIAYQDVVSPKDPEQFIHLAVDGAETRANSGMSRLTTRLAGFGFWCSAPSVKRKCSTLGKCLSLGRRYLSSPSRDARQSLCLRVQI